MPSPITSVMAPTIPPLHTRNQELSYRRPGLGPRLGGPGEVRIESRHRHHPRRRRRCSTSALQYRKNPQKQAK